MSDKKAQSALGLIRANQRKLDGCAGHDFHEIVETPTAVSLWGLTVFVRCRHCRGELDALEAHWYERGLEHGRRRPGRR